MKKFLGKLPVLITFVALAVVMLVAYIGLLVRPVAVGFTYKGEIDKEVVSIKIKNGSEFVMTGEDSDEKIEGRYVVKGREIAIIPYKMSDKEFKDAKEEVLDNWKDYKETMNLVYEANAFKTDAFGEEFTCTGSIVFAIVGGVVLVALLTFGTLSVLYFVKGKKQA